MSMSSRIFFDLWCRCWDLDVPGASGWRIFLVKPNTSLSVGPGGGEMLAVILGPLGRPASDPNAGRRVLGIFRIFLRSSSQV